MYTQYHFPHAYPSFREQILNTPNFTLGRGTNLEYWIPVVCGVNGFSAFLSPHFYFQQLKTPFGIGKCRSLVGVF